jgi:hypothetical protein
MKRIFFAAIFLVMFFAAANGQAPAWTDYSSKEQQFTVSFPGEPTVSKDFVDKERGDKYSFSLGDDHHAYIVMVCDGPAYAGPFTDADLKGRYDAARKATIENMQGSRLISETDLKTGGVSGREFIGDSDQWFYRGRYILTRGRIYGIMALVSRSLETDAATKTAMAKFLDSFHFN